MLQIEKASLKAKGEIIKPKDEKELLEKITSKYKEQTSPYYAASRLWIDAIIDPLETRKVISTGIEIAKKFSQSSNISNIEFIEHNVLDLPFDNESFDFVFSKGVLHHTGNLEKGLDEYSRVLKKGGNGFLYLYANGGIYWNSRDKMREVMKLIPMDFTIKVLDSG